MGFATHRIAIFIFAFQIFAAYATIYINPSVYNVSEGAGYIDVIIGNTASLPERGTFATSSSDGSTYINHVDGN